MKQFITKLTAFISICIALLVLTSGFTLFVISKASFRLPPEKTILVLGDSHTECAVDDALFSQSVNISASAHHYLYTYCKLKKLLSENKHIKTVLLSYNGISEGIDERWLFDDKIIAARIPCYLFLMGKEERDVYRGNKAFALAFLRIPVRKRNLLVMVKFFRNGRLSYKDLRIGGFRKEAGNNLPKDVPDSNKNDTEEKADNFQETTPLRFAFYQTQYLSKIIDFCKAQNVELVLIATPLYKFVNSDADPLLSYYQERLEGVRFLDFRDMVLPESWYKDRAHLNYKGAEFFSRYLAEHYGDLL
jgi:hypothetical protein